MLLQAEYSSFQGVRAHSISLGSHLNLRVTQLYLELVETQFCA